MSRLTMEMTTQQAILAICGGNPGAITATIDLMKNATKVDSENVLGPVGPLFSLDTAGIYESSIWELYNDQCGRNPVRTLGVLRAIQLGFISDVEVRNTLADYSRKLDVNGLLAKVRERLPDFQQED